MSENNNVTADQYTIKQSAEAIKNIVENVSNSFSSTVEKLDNTTTVVQKALKYDGKRLKNATPINNYNHYSNTITYNLYKAEVTQNGDYSAEVNKIQKSIETIQEKFKKVNELADELVASAEEIDRQKQAVEEGLTDQPGDTPGGTSGGGGGGGTGGGGGGGYNPSPQPRKTETNRPTVPNAPTKPNTSTNTPSSNTPNTSNRSNNVSFTNTSNNTTTPNHTTTNTTNDSIIDDKDEHTVPTTTTSKDNPTANASIPLGPKSGGNTPQNVTPNVTPSPEPTKPNLFEDEPLGNSIIGSVRNVVKPVTDTTTSKASIPVIPTVAGLTAAGGAALGSKTFLDREPEFAEGNINSGNKFIPKNANSDNDDDDDDEKIDEYSEKKEDKKPWLYGVGLGIGVGGVLLQKDKKDEYDDEDIESKEEQ